MLLALCWLLVLADGRTFDPLSLPHSISLFPVLKRTRTIPSRSLLSWSRSFIPEGIPLQRLENSWFKCACTSAFAFTFLFSLVSTKPTLLIFKLKVSWASDRATGLLEGW
ncbi:hypothetical protein BDW66DRAFT_137139 [Aspergillus desertorum]